VTEKTPFLAPFYLLKPKHLPRQAPDKHRENSQNSRVLAGWYMNLKIPFQKSVKVTLQLDGVRPVPDTPPGAGHGSNNPTFVIVRGCENLPVHVGTQRCVTNRH
jgi:hypothetical protein